MHLADNQTNTIFQRSNELTLVCVNYVVAVSPSCWLITQENNNAHRIKEAVTFQLKSYVTSC